MGVLADTGGGMGRLRLMTSTFSRVRLAAPFNDGPGEFSLYHVWLVQ